MKRKLLIWLVTPCAIDLDKGKRRTNGALEFDDSVERRRERAVERAEQNNVGVPEGVSVFPV